MSNIKGFFASWKGALARLVETDDLSPDDIIIAVMGPTGSGKSTFINIITDFEIGVGHTLKSCTNEVNNVRISMPELAYGDLVFVDTPGFGNTNKSDTDILKMVVDWLKSTYAKNNLLSGLLYFHRITDNRMVGTPLKNLRMFEELCGKNSFKNVILATTMWDDIDDATGAAREEELKSKYWRAMLDRNSTTGRFLQTRESAFTLIDPLIDAANTRNSILLQREMVDMRKKLPATSAGQQLFSKMEYLVRKREELLHQVRNEMKRSSRDKMTLEPLGEEHEKLKISLESTVNEMRRLRLPLGRRHVKMTENFSKITLRFSNL
ncbi:P-loop containing nucleoside triphosphate hydrolase protein [Phlegmacium glaucopus]|nr:P-loop containing nucleoside triphosphate hydrolase protein [Phlegmacium glaucopus]